MNKPAAQTTSGSPLRSRRRTGQDSRVGLVLSAVLHAVVAGGLLLWSSLSGPASFIAAGPGEGGEGGGGSIQVGVADPSQVLGFAKPVPVSYVGTKDEALNNAVLEPKKPEDTPDEQALLPPVTKPKPQRDHIATDRPIEPQHERPFTGKTEMGRSASSTAQVGHSFGNPTPAVAGGIGIGAGGFGIGTGLPGGSEYGRRIQQILSRNYDPPIVDSAQVQYAVILLRVARDGRILSISNGRVAPQYFKKRCPLPLVNDAAERAILASKQLPPFPLGFLPGASEAVAEVWFRYPK